MELEIWVSNFTCSFFFFLQFSLENLFIRNIIIMLRDLSFGDLEKKISMISGGSFATVVAATDPPFNLKTVTQGSQSCTSSIITVNGQSTKGNSKFNLLEAPQVLISGEIHGDERVVS